MCEYNLMADKTKQNLLKSAVTNGDCETVCVMLQRGAVPSRSMADKAWEKKRYKIVLLLLKADSEYPDEFDMDEIEDRDETFDELKRFDELREELHKAIRNGALDKVHQLTLNMDKSKKYLNRDHHSALYTALKHKHFHISTWFKTELNAEFKNENEKNYFEKSILVMANEHYTSTLPFTDNAHILYLLSKSISAKGSQDFHNFYLELDQIPEISYVLRVLQFSDIQSVIYDGDRAFTESSVNGDCDFFAGKILITAQGQRAALLGTIAHELTHFAMKTVYENECNPYKKNDMEKTEKYNKMVENVRVNKGIDEIIQRAFTEYSEEDVHRELIVRVNHVLAAYGVEVGTRLLKEQVPELLQFYTDEVIPRCQAFIDDNPRMRIKTHIRMLNDYSGVINSVKELKVELKNSVWNGERNPIQCLATEHVLLSAIRVLSSFENDINNILVFNFSRYLTQRSYIHTIFSYNVCKTLILLCDSEPDDKFYESLQLLFSLVDERRGKNIIVIIKKSNETVGISDAPSFCFRDLSEKSREMLSGRTVYLQTYKTTLREILDEDSYDLIDSKTLVKLINGDIITLGKPQVKDNNYDENYYIDRVLESGRLFEDVELIDCAEHKFIVVSDSAGMGKTTLLTHLARILKKRHPLLWVVRVNLNDCTKVLDNCSNEVSDFIDLLMKLMEARTEIRFESEFEKKLFSHLIKNVHDTIVTMFDGYDEIKESHQNAVINVLKSLKYTKVKQMFVTTRPQLRNVLESSLNQISYTLQPFKTIDQVNFLTKFWSCRLNKAGADVNRVRKYSEGLINVLSKSISDRERSFTGVPLQCRMLAESYEAEFRRYYHVPEQNSPKFPEKINLRHLYRQFFDVKYNIYRLDKNETDLSKPNVETENEELKTKYLKNHQLASVRTLFSESETELLLTPREIEKVLTFIGKISSNRYNTGLIETIVNDEPRFVHLTFAEYLLAEFLVLKMSSKLNKKLIRFVFESVLRADKYPVIRSFVDTHLAKTGLTPTVICHVNKIIKTSKQKIFQDGEQTVLHVAAKEGNSHITSFILKCLQTNNFRKNALRWLDENGHQAAHLATEKNHVKVMEVLVVSGADVNAINKKGQTPLHLAAFHGHIRLTQFLLKSSGINVNVVDEDEYTPLHLAVRGDHHQVVELLATANSYDADATQVENLELHVAVLKGDYDITELLLRNENVAINAVNKKGQTPLHLSVSGSQHKLTKLLLKVDGVDVNACDHFGRTSLHFAATIGDFQSVELLLNSVHIDVNAVDKTSSTALHMAADWGHLKPLELLLKQEGVQVNAADNERRTPLHWAASKNHCKLIERLLGAPDINTNASDEKGLTPLHLAVSCSRYKSVKILLQGADVDVNAEDHEGNTSLHLAAENDSYKAAKLLLRAENVTVNAVNKAGCVPLHVAASLGHFKTIDILLQSADVDVNAVDDEKRTPLHLAAKKGHYKSIELLLKSGRVDVNAADNGRNTPLHYAASLGHLKSTELLVQTEDIDFNAVNKYGKTALNFAVAKNHHGVVDILKRGNAHDDDCLDEDGSTALHMAVLKNDLKWTERLLRDDKTKINAVNKAGRTPLHLAASRGHFKLTKLLLKAENVAINAVDDKRYTPLHAAASNGDFRTLRLLLEVKDIDVNARQVTMSVPLHWAAARGELRSLELLLGALGVDVNAADVVGSTPLHWAVSECDWKSVGKLLRAENINVNAVNSNGDTPLHWSASDGDFKTMELLLAVDGVNVNAVGSNGRTPLHWASSKGFYISVELLLKAECDINAVDECGHTALHMAAFGGHYKTVELLLRTPDVKIDVVDNDGWTPLRLATTCDHQSVVELLTRAKAKKNDDEMDMLECTPLHLAVLKDDLIEVQQLLKTDGNQVNVVNKMGGTPLHLAALKGHHRATQLLLKAESIDVNAADIDGRTPLHLAALNGHLESTQLLLQAVNIKVNVIDKDFRTPLRLAIKMNHQCVKQLLLNANCLKSDKN